jgi:hypothetical protein
MDILIKHDIFDENIENNQNIANGFYHLKPTIFEFIQIFYLHQYGVEDHLDLL